MSGILVIEERDAIAEILVARLRESPFVKHCRRIRTPETHSLAHRVCALAGPLRDENVDAVVYSPSRLAPLRMTPNLAEAEAFLRLFTQSQIGKLILLSSAQIYGAGCHNQGLIPETRTPVCLNRSWLADEWSELEEIAARHCRANGTQLAILRPAATPVLSGDDYFSKLLRGPLAFVLPGHDPSLQFLSPDDLAVAVRCAFERKAVGVYNVAPDSVITLRAALLLTGARRVLIPRTLRRLFTSAEHLDFIRYSWTVSNQKIKSELGCAPKHSSATALHNFMVAENGRARGQSVAAREFDDFGMDKNYIAAYGRTLFNFLHQHYWRVEHRGLEYVPQQGRAILVGVHRGFMPWDAVMALHTIVNGIKRYPRFLIHPGLIKFPFLFNFHTKLGGIIACQENADYVLDRNELLTIYPEGIRGAFSLFRQPYRLKRFRDDYVKIALRHRAPLVPFVTVGSAEIFPIVKRIDWSWWKRWTEWPFFPLTPTWPLLPVPLPSKWHLQFLPPIRLAHPPEAADDPDIVSAITADVKSQLTGAIDEMLSRRKSIWFGSVFQDEKPLDERSANE